MAMNPKDQRRLMWSECKHCGESFAVHGADRPHTRGEECPGFTPRDATLGPLIVQHEEERYRRLSGQST